MQSRNSGTETVLDLVVPWLLNDQGEYNFGNDAVPTDPSSDPQATAVPPETKTAEPPPNELSPQH
jgi:hypothetical protein